ncbi:BlaI/MecI/CopY family transcriptional regulator [Vallitalea guaymasensis]|uniref:BlaI/MecI/CopY family transcriptional regulator n=1 Tax=Vallitalea guaymasensis TaxID=1185412 RepID=A0A8J8MBQ7_9FIRM|nr:BlaI/MecI/CopY family transcriptional regulator [Vallitalea guaymasensis]QUH29973.1 BlaI/MecI/CopY family transcriptional regulator [Vallitalea guaymasensis]
MNSKRKLPDAEFEIMNEIWKTTPPITSNILMEKLGEKKKWKVQTLISMLNRLVKREFLSTEKKGKERTYLPLVTKEDYLKFETENFIERFHENSIISLVNTLYNDKKLKDKDIEELSALLKDWGE